MALGGMRDHIGGGFHRYSVDAAWRVPHFEKMLYDQAQLVLAFLEATQVSGDPFYAEVAEDTLLYVMREMTDTDGAFYSAEDADSLPPEDAESPGAHKKEGAFYLWRADEVDALLGEDAAIVKLRYGIEADGNAPQDPQQEFTGKNLLYVARSVDDIAARVGKTPDEVVEILNRTRVRMFQHRSFGHARIATTSSVRRERPDDCGVCPHGSRLRRRRRRRAEGEQYLQAAASVRVHSRTDGAPKIAPARRYRVAMLRSTVMPRLCLPHVRPARAVPGRRRPDVARVGDRTAAKAGRTVLG